MTVVKDFNLYKPHMSPLMGFTGLGNKTLTPHVHERHIILRFKLTTSLFYSTAGDGAPARSRRICGDEVLRRRESSRGG